MGRAVRDLPLGLLVAVPVLLAVATAAAQFAHSDVDVALLYSQCHAAGAAGLALAGARGGRAVVLLSSASSRRLWGRRRHQPPGAAGPLPSWAPCSRWWAGC